MEKLKKCPSCNKNLEYIYFSKGTSIEGLQSYCKVCIKIRNRKNNPIKLNNHNDNNLNEYWKVIKNYELSYMISSLGNVKSIDRVNESVDGRVYFRKGKILKKQINIKNGYESILLGYKGKRLFIHRLVAETFIENHKNKKCVNHKNKIRNDNRVQNLEWVTYKENNEHSKL